MPNNFFKLGISGGSARAFILLFNALVWLFMTTTMINNILNEVTTISSVQTFLVWTIYYAALITAIIIGAFLSTKINRMILIQFWIMLGVITALIPIIVNNFTLELVYITCGFWGISFGLGMPSCLAYFTDSTNVEKRGRTGGIILLTTNITASILMILLGETNLMVNTIVFTLWRTTALLGFVVRSIKGEDVIEKKKNTKFISILVDKSFLLYFVAWFMFCFIDRFEMPIINLIMQDLPYNSIINIMGPIIGSISALVAGLLSDQIGRKRVVLFGFATLGIAYAIIGLAPDFHLSKIIYEIIDSTSTGILWLIFLLIIWGDLSKNSASEKYYAIGAIPFFLTSLVSKYIILLTDEYIAAISAFSLASIFLFVAVLPLL